MHGRRENHRGARHQKGACEQVIRHSGGCPGQQIRGGRRDDHQVRLLAKTHMADLVDGLEHTVADGVSRERLPGGSAHEPLGRFGGYDRYVVAGLSEQTQEGRHLVGGDPSSNSQDDTHVGTFD